MVSLALLSLVNGEWPMHPVGAAMRDRMHRVGPVIEVILQLIASAQNVEDRNLGVLAITKDPFMHPREMRGVDGVLRVTSRTALPMGWRVVRHRELGIGELREFRD